jgi:hypothetical protein
LEDSVPLGTGDGSNDSVSGTEYLLLAAVILVPLAIAVVVTLWSLEQARYRPKRRPDKRVPPAESDDSAGAS